MSKKPKKTQQSESQQESSDNFVTLGDAANTVVGNLDAGPGAGGETRKPSVGRIVHFSPAGSNQKYAAIVTAVHPGHTVLDLTVFYPNEQPKLGAGVEYGERHETAKRRWYWPIPV